MSCGRGEAAFCWVLGAARRRRRCCWLLPLHAQQYLRGRQTAVLLSLFAGVPQGLLRPGRHDSAQRGEDARPPKLHARPTLQGSQLPMCGRLLAIPCYAGGRWGWLCMMCSAAAKQTLVLQVAAYWRGLLAGLKQRRWSPPCSLPAPWIRGAAGWVSLQACLAASSAAAALHSWCCASAAALRSHAFPQPAAAPHARQYCHVHPASSAPAAAGTPHFVPPSWDIPMRGPSPLDPTDVWQPTGGLLAAKSGMQPS